MRHYAIKRGYKENLEKENLRALVLESFGDCKEDGDKFVASFGALKHISIWTEDKDLVLDTEMDATVSNEVAMDTIKRYNDFLYKTTGYTSKDRKKRAEKEAKK